MATQRGVQGVVAVLTGALPYAFARAGMTIRSDPEQKGRSDQGGQEMV